MNEAKEDGAAVPITSLDAHFQHYVFLTRQIDTEYAKVKQLREQRKVHTPYVCTYLRNQPKSKQKFTITTKQASEAFGESYVGLATFKRKRWKAFNGRTIKHAMVENCVPLFQASFHAKVPPEAIVKFATKLASNLWESRQCATNFEIMPILNEQTLLAKKSGKKRKEGVDNNPAPTSHARPNPPPSAASSDEENANIGGEDEDF